MSTPSPASTPEDRLSALESEVKALKAKAAAKPATSIGDDEAAIDRYIEMELVPKRLKPTDSAQFAQFRKETEEAIAKRVFDESKSKKISPALRRDVADGEVTALDALRSVGIDPLKKGISIPTPSAAFLGPFTENPAQTAIWVLIGVFGAAIVWSFL